MWEINQQIEYANEGIELVRPFGPFIYKHKITSYLHHQLTEWSKDLSDKKEVGGKRSGANYQSDLFHEFQDTANDEITKSYNLLGHIDLDSLKEIKEHCSGYVNAYCKHPVQARTHLRERVRLTHFWINIQQERQWQPKHNHTGDLSFVIYVKQPKSNKSAVGNITFSYGETMNWSGDDMQIKPEEKDILIFPAWLKHQAFPFVENNQTRITAAGNVAIMNK